MSDNERAARIVDLAVEYRRAMLSSTGNGKTVFRYLDLVRAVDEEIARRENAVTLDGTEVSNGR